MLADNVAVFAADSGDVTLVELFSAAQALRPVLPDVSDWHRADSSDIAQISDLVSRLNRIAGFYVTTPSWSGAGLQQRTEDFTEDEKTASLQPSGTNLNNTSTSQSQSKRFW